MAMVCPITIELKLETMNLYNLNETSEKTGVSRATIYRFYEKNPDLWKETKIKIKRRLIPEAHLNLITKTNIYAKALALDEQTVQLKRLVDLLANPNLIQYKLYQMDWDWFGTIAFKRDINKKYSYHQMLQAFDYIMNIYGKEIGLRIFFTVEPFNNREGTHIHFLLKVGNGLLTNAIIEELKGFFKNNRVDLKPYNKYKAGIYYIAKKGLQGTDWDILGNDLSKFGIKNETNSNTKAI